MLNESLQAAAELSGHPARAAAVVAFELLVCLLVLGNRLSCLKHGELQQPGGWIVRRADQPGKFAFFFVSLLIIETGATIAASVALWVALGKVLT